MESNKCLKTHILYLYSVIGIYQFHVSESTLLGLDAGEHNPSTELVHVVLLQVLKLCRVAVDTSSFNSSLLRLVPSVHLEVISGHASIFVMMVTSNVILESEVSTLTSLNPILVSTGPAASRGRKTLIQRGQFTPGSSFSFRVVQQMLNLGQD